MVTFARRAKTVCTGLLGFSACFGLLVAVAAPVAAQSVQSSGGVDGDLAQPAGNVPPPPPPPPVQAPYAQSAPADAGGQAMASTPAGPVCGHRPGANGGDPADDLIGSAEGVFGTGARGLAAVIRDILRKQGIPDGYIAGREAGGAFAIGVRYGSGMLCQKKQLPMPVYWTGPSIGFDVGASAAKTFVLVYNLNNADDLFHRFGAGEGQAYLVGGLNVSYLRRGNMVLIPVRMGVGLRLGISAGWMKFSRHQKWLPF